MTDEEIVALALCADNFAKTTLWGKVLVGPRDLFKLTRDKEFARLVASHQRDEILTLIKAYGDARYKEWKGDRTSPHYRSTYMEGMSDASDDILSHILKSAAIREQGKE